MRAEPMSKTRLVKAVLFGCLVAKAMFPTSALMAQGGSVITGIAWSGNTTDCTPASGFVNIEPITTLNASCTTGGDRVTHIARANIEGGLLRSFAYVGLNGALLEDAFLTSNGRSINFGTSVTTQWIDAARFVDPLGMASVFSLDVRVTGKISGYINDSGGCTASRNNTTFYASDVDGFFFEQLQVAGAVSSAACEPLYPASDLLEVGSLTPVSIDRTFRLFAPVIDGRAVFTYGLRNSVSTSQTLNFSAFTGPFTGEFRSDFENTVTVTGFSVLDAQGVDISGLVTTAFENGTVVVSEPPAFILAVTTLAVLLMGGSIRHRHGCAGSREHLTS